MEYDFARILGDMLVGIAFASSDETGAMKFLFFLIVRTFDLIDLGEQKIQFCFELFSLFFFHRFSIPVFPARFELIDCEFPHRPRSGCRAGFRLRPGQGGCTAHLSHGICDSTA
jgi:hypothetical protein